MNAPLPAGPTPDPRVGPAVRKLVCLNLRLGYNTFRHNRLGRKIAQVMLGVFFVGMAVMLLFGSWTTLAALRSPRLISYLGSRFIPFVEGIPALLLAGLFIGMLLTSFGVLLQALYLSGDMEFLLATPVPIRAVFITKLIQAVLPNFGLVSVLGLPILFGLGLSGGYHFLYYPLVVIVMLFLALAGAGLASLLVMLVVRLLPPRRAAEVLGFIGALLAFSCNFGNLFGQDTQLDPAQFSNLILRASTPWLPLNWAGRGLVALGEGRWLSGALQVGSTLVLASLAFGFALVTAERWFYSGWAGMQVVARRKAVRADRRSETSAGQRLAGLVRFLPAPVRAILRKDFITLRRDLRNLSQLISPVLLGVVYTISMLRGGGAAPPGRGEAPGWFMDSFQLVLDYSSVGMSLFVGWMLLTRLAGIGFSQEGRNYWILKAAPVSAGQLLLSKFLVAYLPPWALSVVFVTVISILQGLSLFQFLYSLVAASLCLAGAAGLLLAFGAVGATFNWADPRRMNAGSLGCLGQLLTVVYVPLAFACFIGPLGLAGFFGWPIAYGYLAGFFLGTGAAVACAWVPLGWARARVERLNED